jgi:hypothetical protein
MQTGVPDEPEKTEGLSAEKREDIWALLIAALVLIASLAAPEAIYEFFKNMLYIF